jgi:hypothetical protein
MKIKHYFTMLGLIALSPFASAVGGQVNIDGNRMDAIFSIHEGGSGTPLHSYLTASSSATSSTNGVVTFTARDYDYHYFVCYVGIRSPLYDYAREVSHNLGNGGFVRIDKNAESECTSIFYENASYRRD